MSNRSKLNHLSIAKEIYEYMKYKYKFLTHLGMEVDRCVDTLSKKLLHKWGYLQKKFNQWVLPARSIEGDSRALYFFSYRELVKGIN